MKLIADPRNPAQYFGACGLFELVSMQDRSLMAYWDQNGLIIEALSDDAFKQTINAFANADLVPDEDWNEKNATQPYTLAHAPSDFHIQMDWWELRDGSDTSFWKCFAANQKSTALTATLLAACRGLVNHADGQNLLQLNCPLTGRLGFDPRSAWNALDTGFSPNDFDETLKSVPTYVFAEVLSAIAMQRWPFQPSRKECSYRLWTRPLPLAVARVVAAAGQGPVYAFSRVMRSKGFPCFTYSRPLRA